MNKLLKDMPECMEKIENNSLLEQDLLDCLTEHEDFSENRQNYVLDSDNYKIAIKDIISKVAEFVNQNYTWKGSLKDKVIAALNQNVNDFDDAICPDGERRDIIGVDLCNFNSVAERVIA